MKKSLLLLIIFFSATCLAANESQQMLVVMTPDWDAVKGTLQRYQRDNHMHKWQQVGEPVPVVVGHNGMAWGADTAKFSTQDQPIKKEGDGKTPVGIFKIGDAFGFADSSNSTTKLNYLPIKTNTICIDDADSRYYNQIIDSLSIINKDWQSGEIMHDVPLYEHGAVVEYNTKHPIKGAGSCIFLHIWRSPEDGTGGCVAMDEVELIKILAWLDVSKKPVIVLLTKSIGEKFVMPV